MNQGRGGGQGSGGGGRGRGQGRGRGMGPGGGSGAGQGFGPEGNCVCHQCGEKAPHRQGQPCYEIKCPKCGTNMIRE